MHETIASKSDKEIQSICSLLAEPPTRFRSALNEVNAVVLKDDGCNTNVVCKDFIKRNGSRFEVHPYHIKVVHSGKGSSKTAPKMFVNAALRLGSHEYVSNWAIVDSRYDVLLEMLCHKSINPEIDYSVPFVSVKNIFLPVVLTRNDNDIRITNIGVENFKSVLRRNGKTNDFILYQMTEKGTDCIENKSVQNNKKLQSLLKRYSCVFRKNLSAGHLPETAVDTAIATDLNVKILNRLLYQLSPAELSAAITYVE